MSNSFRHLPLDLIYLYFFLLLYYKKKKTRAPQSPLLPVSSGYSLSNTQFYLLDVQKNHLSCHSQFWLLGKSNSKQLLQELKEKKNSAPSLTCFCFMRFELHVLSFLFYKINTQVRTLQPLSSLSRKLPN